MFCWGLWHFCALVMFLPKPQCVAFEYITILKRVRVYVWPLYCVRIEVSTQLLHFSVCIPYIFLKATDLLILLCRDANCQMPHFLLCICISY